MTENLWKRPMSKGVQVRGWSFFALYLFVFPYLTGQVQRLWMNQGEIPVAESNLVSYAILLALTVLVFYPLVRRDFDRLVDHFPGCFSALLMGFALWLALILVVRRIPLPVESPVLYQWGQEFQFAPGITVLLVLVLMPFIEEIFFRGLVFGSFRGKSRLLAYVLSVAVFALGSVWRYAVDLGDWRYLLTALYDLPAALALGWSYEKSGSVWTAVLLRIVIHGAIFVYYVI